MLTGKQFKLNRTTLAIEQVDGKRRAVEVPSGAHLRVLAGPHNGDGLVKVLWDGRTVEMFAVDVNVRGTEILGTALTPNRRRIY